MKKFTVIKVVEKRFTSNGLMSYDVNKPISKDLVLISQTPVYPVVQKTYFLFGVIPFFRATKYLQENEIIGNS